MSSTQEMRPPYVRFTRMAVEDRTQSLANGKFGFKDVDIAKITVPGQKDIVERYVEDWFKELDRQAGDGRIPYEWPENYRKAYQFWKSGQEVPVNGTPIKGWPVLSPSQQETLLMSGVLTVEDLADASDEAVRHIGIGAVSLKNKAKAWLKEARSTGSLAEENASLKRDVEAQQTQVNTLMTELAELKKRLPAAAPDSVEKASF